MTKFRISAHDLEFEKGRYKNLPVNERYCKLCDNSSVEDEVHLSVHLWMISEIILLTR